MKKIICKVQILLILSALVLSGCAENEDMVDVNGWRDKLVEINPPSVNLPDKEDLENIKNDAADLLEEGASQTYDTAAELGKGAASLLNSWLNQSLPEYAQTDNMQDTPAETGNGRIEVSLLYVVDGDTIIVEYENEEVKVRLIGINTPESVASEEYLEKTGKENTAEGKEASAFLKGYLVDTESVWLEFDEQLHDDYGRLLAYVWMNNSGNDIAKDMLNGILLHLGYAEQMIIEPNCKYEEELSSVAENGV